jgi:hypothetical protein
MDRCLKELEKTHEYDSDVDLAFYVRVQHLIGRIAQLNQQDKDTEELEPLPTAGALPHAAYMAAYQAELDTIRKTIPSRLKTDSALLSIMPSPLFCLFALPSLALLTPRAWQRSFKHT